MTPDGIEAGFHGTWQSDSTVPGVINLDSSSIPDGIGPGVDLPFFAFDFKATQTQGTAAVTLEIREARDKSYAPITGMAETLPASITIGSGTVVLKGDVDGNGVVNIIDALMIAQYSVGLNLSTNFNVLAADVNGDIMINIIDALMVAQYSVGLIQLG